MVVEMPSKAIILTAGPGSRMGALTQYASNMDQGPQNKTNLPVALTPVNVRLIHMLHRQCGVNDFYVNSHYLAGDVVKVLGHGERFGRDVRIRHDVNDRLVSTGEAVRNIVNGGAYRDNFKPGETFWVVAGDISFPTADLAGFRDNFLRANQENKGRLLAGVGFVLRPVPTMVLKYPSAILDKKGIAKIVEQPANEEAATRIFESSRHPVVRSSMPHQLPLNTAIFLMNREIFDTIPRPRGPEDAYDIGRYIFVQPQMAGRLWGHIFNDYFHTSSGVFYGYHDIGEPKDYYRAQWAFIRTAFKMIRGVYNPAINSWVGPRKQIEGMVSNSVIGDYVYIGRNCRIENSIICDGSRIHDSEISGSVLLPFTEIGCWPAPNPHYVIRNSIVGGKIAGGSPIDPNTTGRVKFIKSIAVPDIHGNLEVDDLDLDPTDQTLPVAAFTDLRDDPPRPEPLQIELPFEEPPKK